MVELDGGGLLASCTLGCAGLSAPPRPRDSSRHCCRADLPRGLSSDPAARSDASPPITETPCLPWLSWGKVPRAVKSKTCAHEVAEAATLCIYRCSFLPAMVTVRAYGLARTPVLSLGRLGREGGLLPSALPAWSGGERGDPSQQLEGLVLSASKWEGWRVPGATML